MDTLTALGTNAVTAEDLEKVKEFIQINKGIEGGLIPVLHLVQEHFGFIPYEAQRLIAQEMKIPLSDVYGVVTFYSRFTLAPTGRYNISVCLGTACYVRGAEKLVDIVSTKLGIKVGESTADGMYTLDATRCVGACGLAPIMMVNTDVYGKVMPEDVEKILSKYR